MTVWVRWLDSVGMGDLDVVGGKNASIGEMLVNLTDLGVSSPGGFATTADAYREFLSASGLDEKIDSLVTSIDIEDVVLLASVGKQVREMIEAATLPT